MTTNIGGAEPGTRRTASVQMCQRKPLKRQFKEESEKFLLNIWTQITVAFNNGYDHHLLFETLNEPRLRGNQYEWYFVKGQADCDEGASVLNEYMKHKKLTYLR